MFSHLNSIKYIQTRPTKYSLLCFCFCALDHYVVGSVFILFYSIQVPFDELGSAYRGFSSYHIRCKFLWFHFVCGRKVKFMFSLLFLLDGSLSQFSLWVAMSVNCVLVPLWKACFSVDWRLLVQEHIANIGIDEIYNSNKIGLIGRIWS